MENYYFIGYYLNQEGQAHCVFVKGSLGRAKQIQDSYFYSDFFITRSILEATKEQIDECRNDAPISNKVSIIE